jgi:NADPH:quinone reductase
MSTPATYRAAVVHEYGGPEKIAIERLTTPSLASGEILIEVRAAGVNLVDTMFRDGYLSTGPLPLTLGSDFAGTVLDPGDVTGYAPGDAVYGYKLLGNGTYAELATVHSSLLARKPGSLSFEQAAALPCAGLVAYDAIVRTLAVTPGETVLIGGASGGVGHLAVQIAKAHGATVIGTTSTRNLEFVAALGADIVLDYATEDIPQAVRRHVPDGVDAALPTVADAEHDAVGGTRAAGRITWINGPQGPPLERGISGRETNGSHGTELLDALSAMIADATLRTIHIDKRYPLGQAAQAQIDVARGHIRGKLVIATRDQPSTS